jgi:hypothetical protein
MMITLDLRSITHIALTSPTPCRDSKIFAVYPAHRRLGGCIILTLQPSLAASHALAISHFDESLLKAAEL